MADRAGEEALGALPNEFKWLLWTAQRGRTVWIHGQRLALGALCSGHETLTITDRVSKPVLLLEVPFIIHKYKFYY